MVVRIFRAERGNFLQITYGIKKRQLLAFRYQKDRTGAVVSITVRVLDNFRKDGTILHIVGQLHFLQQDGAASGTVLYAILQYFGQFSVVEADALLVEDRNCDNSALVDGILVVGRIHAFPPRLWQHILSFLQRGNMGGFLNHVTVSHDSQYQSVRYTHIGLRSTTKRDVVGIPHLDSVGIDGCSQNFAVHP